MLPEEQRHEELLLLERLLPDCPEFGDVLQQVGCPAMVLSGNVATQVYEEEQGDGEEQGQMLQDEVQGRPCEDDANMLVGQMLNGEQLEELLPEEWSDDQAAEDQMDREKEVMAPFLKGLHKIQTWKCTVCSEAKLEVPTRAAVEATFVCSRCRKDRHATPLFGTVNGMHPGEVPAELEGLTWAEKLLIAPAVRACKVVRLKHNGRPGNLRLKGHIVTLLQDVAPLVHTLPRLPTNCGVLILRSRSTANEPIPSSVLKVRRAKVQAALEWLRDNWPLWGKYELEIDPTNLAALPENGAPDQAPVSQPSTTTRPRFQVVPRRWMTLAQLDPHPMEMLLRNQR